MGKIEIGDNLLFAIIVVGFFTFMIAMALNT